MLDDAADVEAVNVRDAQSRSANDAGGAAENSPTGGQQTTAPVNSSASDTERIQEILEDVQPRTWIFAGDNLGFEVQQARRGWIEHFSDFIKERLTRKHDMILNSTFAGSTVARLIEEVEWRVLRFQPDVVLIMPSPDECATYGDQDEFREHLLRLVESFHNEGCMVVLNTPPCPATAGNAEKEKLKTAASRIRSVADQSGAVLSDHFSHWQTTLQRDGDQANLHDDSGQQPSARGHRELARRLLKSLNVRSN